MKGLPLVCPIWSDQSGNTKVTEDTLPHNEEIAGVLRDGILRGQYRPGEHLPYQLNRLTRESLVRSMNEAVSSAIVEGVS